MRYGAGIMNYGEAERYLAEGKDPDDRPAPQGTATRIQRHENGDIAVKYHDTDVVTYHPDGSITLNSGGWRTMTTKSRMSSYTPLYVYQQDYVWGVTYKDINGKRQDVSYEDGMTFHPDGLGWMVFGEGNESEADDQRELIDDIHEYAKDFVEALNRGDVGQPSAGDCWYCSMQVCGEDRTLGEAIHEDVGRDSHLVSHIEESYFVPSLLFRVVEQGWMSRFAEEACYKAMMQGETGVFDEYPYKIVKGQVVSAIRKYMHRQLDLPDNVKTSYR